MKNIEKFLFSFIFVLFSFHYALAQGSVPTPLQPGAYVEFSSLTSPDDSTQTVIYAIIPMDPGKGGGEEKLLMLGTPLSAISQILESTELTTSDLIAAGVSTSSIQNAIDYASGQTGAISFWRYVYYNPTNIMYAEYSEKSTATITVLPRFNADTGIVEIRDTLGWSRHFSVPISNGVPATVTVHGMEAGVTSFRVLLRSSGAFVADERIRYALSKNQTRSIALPESGPSPAFPLATIARAIVTQSNQNDEGTAPLIAGRRGRFLVYLLDGQNLAGAAQVTLTVNLPAIGSQNIPIGSGGNGYFSSDDRVFLDAEVPGNLIQPGATFVFTARLSDGTVLSRTYNPDVRQGRRITVNVFEVSPGPGYSGVPVARDAVGFRDQIAQWVEAQLPVEGLDINIRGYIPWPASYVPFWPWDDPGYIISDMANLAAWMNSFAAAEGSTRTDGQIYLAMINGRYSKSDISGISGGKGSPGIAMFLYNQEDARGTLAHEMGHAHWLGHSPSPGATTGLNPIDWDYPYGADSVIAFAPWHPMLGGYMPTTNHDIMSYGSYRWISDFNWIRFFERTWDSGWFFAAANPSPAPFVSNIRPGTTFVLGEKEAQELADYVDSLSPYACSSLTVQEIETAKSQLRQAPRSPAKAGHPCVIVKAVVAPKRPIAITGPSRAATALERLLALPEVHINEKR